MTTQQLGRYQLLRRLAVGGMAEIYLARAQGISGFEKLVVLKRILPQHALDPQLLRMFLDEARLTATLTHPNITQVYDVGTEGDIPFFAMEHVHGANLREIVNAATASSGGSALPLPHVIGIVAAAAAGLHYAHEKVGPSGQPLQIVHRDVSPSNVLVTYDGAVKVSDFGIAKWSSQRTQTQEGALKGKFAYMSPEQCRSQPVDRRSDVFALGTLLFELTTGEAPFRGDSDYEILNQIVNQPPARPRSPAGEYPAELERIVMRALARLPGDRYPTAQALQLDLETFARAQKLVVSAVELSRYMHSLFADHIAAWQKAQQEGKSLGQHLTQPEAGAAGAAKASAEETQPTVTEGFAARLRPVRGTTPRRAVVAAIAGGALMVAAGTVAALKLRAAGPRTPSSTSTSTSTSTPARAMAPGAGAVSDAGVSTGPGAAPTVEGHLPTPAPAPMRPKRLGRSRSSPATTPGAGGDGDLKTWDPDSPVPP